MESLIVFGDGVRYKTDYVASIPTPPCLYIRLLDLTMLQAMTIATNEQAMSKISYNGFVFYNCAVIAVSDENGTPKISASYETMERTGG